MASRWATAARRMGLTTWGRLSDGPPPLPYPRISDGWTGSSPIHAILWPTAGGMLDLGTLPGETFSAASKINFFGQVIGISGNTAAFEAY